MQKETQSLATKKLKTKDLKRPALSSHLTDNAPPLTDTPSEPGHTHHHPPPAPNPTKMLISHGRPQDVANLERPPSKRSKPHAGVVSMETGVVTTETKTKHLKGVHKKVLKHGIKRSKVNAKSILIGGGDIDAQEIKMVNKKERKRKFSYDFNSSEDSIEVDVTTPVDTDASLSVSLKKKLIKLDTSDTVETIKPNSQSLLVSFNRNTIPQLSPAQNSSKGISDSKPSRRMSHETLAPPTGCGPTSPSNSEEMYRVEFDGTKMIFRSDGGEKTKKKKKHKKKASKKAKAKSHDASGESHDLSSKSHDPSGTSSHDTSSIIEFSDPLKVKIKL